MAKSKSSYAVFFAKAIPLSIVLGGGAFYATERYSIGVDPQEHTCLPYRVFLIDRHDKDIERGEIAAFSSKRMTPYFKDGTQVIKVADGVPGDRVKVGPERVSVNGTEVGTGLALTKALKKPVTRFTRDEVLGPDQFWFMGKTPDSYDSRYWGTVDRSQLIGRAYPIW